MLEKTLEKKCCAYALTLGVTSIKLTSVSSRGYPDRIFWAPAGKPLLVEFKSVSGALSKHQSIIINRLENLGYIIAVISDFECFVNVIRKILHK